MFVRLCGSAGLEQKKVGGRRKASTALRLLEDGTTGQISTPKESSPAEFEI